MKPDFFLGLVFFLGMMARASRYISLFFSLSPPYNLLLWCADWQECLPLGIVMYDV
jgi:hypothetical protein